MGISIGRILLAVAVAYGCYAAICFFAQRIIMYPGRNIRAPASLPRDESGSIVPIWLETGFGRSEAWFMPARRKSGGRRPIILFFHGNGEIIDFLPDQVQGFRDLGMGVLLVEYPGYGRSKGKPSEASIAATAVAAYDAVAKREEVDTGRIVAFGRSLGGGPASALSRERQLAAIILQSPFISTRSFARQFFLPGFLIRDVYDNRRALMAYQGPLLVMHGRYDDIVPFAHGEELARVSRNADFVGFNCAHNDCPPDGEEFWRVIARFLQRSGIIEPAGIPPIHRKK